MMYRGAVVHDGPFPLSRSGRTLEFMGPNEEFLNFCSSSSKGLPIRGDKEVRLDKLDCSEETPLRRAMPGGAGRVFQKRPTWIAHFSPLVGYALHKGCLDGVQATFLFIVLRTFCLCGTSSLYWTCGTFRREGSAHDVHTDSGQVPSLVPMRRSAHSNGADAYPRCECRYINKVRTESHRTRRAKLVMDSSER